MDEWTDLDQAYLDIFGNHPDDLRPRRTVPSNEYLTRVGEFTFWVASLEWDIVGDILVAGSGIDAVGLLGRSTGAIGYALRDGATGVTGRPHTRHFMETGARALIDVAQRRNHVMHARPARRADGSVILLRLREHRGERQRIWVDEEFLARQTKVVHYWIRRVSVASTLTPD